MFIGNQAKAGGLLWNEANCDIGFADIKQARKLLTKTRNIRAGKKK